MIITHKIDMSLDAPGSLPRIEMVQGDAWTRVVRLSLFDQGLAWQIPDGVRTVVRFIRPDGCGGEYETLPDGTAAATISGSTLEVVLVPEALTAAGLVLMSVSLISGELEISTFHIQIDVHTHVGVRLLNSGSYYKAPWLEKAIDQLNQNMDRLQQDMAAVRQDVAGTQDGTAVQEQRLAALQQKVTVLQNFTLAQQETDAAQDRDIAALEQEIAALKYVPMDITSVSNNVNTAELGETVDSVTISWAVNKVPASQTVEGEAVSIGARSKVLSGLALTAPRTFIVTATDAEGTTDTATTSVMFCNGIYFGALAYGTAMDSAALRLLNKSLRSGRAMDFSVQADGKRPVYALPARYGTPVFRINGFTYEWEKVAAFDFTNASGYTESYDVWMHGQDVAGPITVNVT